MEIFRREWDAGAGKESTTVSCEFRENGRLRFESQIIGPSVAGAWGDSDIERWAEFSPEDVRRLIPLILKDAFNSDKPMTYGQVLELALANGIETNSGSWT